MKICKKKLYIKVFSLQNNSMYKKMLFLWILCHCCCILNFASFPSGYFNFSQHLLIVPISCRVQTRSSRCGCFDWINFLGPPIWIQIELFTPILSVPTIVFSLVTNALISWFPSTDAISIAASSVNISFYASWCGQSTEYLADQNNTPEN